MVDQQTAISETIKAAPPIAVGASHVLFGLSLPDWVSVVTITWFSLLILEKLVKLVKAWRAAR